ncbi:MAG: hypothetical protein P1P90_05545 [Patescibacteria group bacterium]|nr:hypothetical protein [Patescibacteria group bacterium]
MEPKAISKLKFWFDRQVLIRNKRMAFIMDELSKGVPPVLARTIRRTRVIEELFTSGSITITACLQPKQGCEFQVETFDQLEKSMDSLKDAWKGVVSVWVQRLDEEGIMNIRFDAL